jgi:hypothetical protein
MNVGLGAGLAGGRVAAAPAFPNPNLLLWSEEMQRAAWTTTGVVVVVADMGSDPLGGMTADQITFGSAGASVLQATPVAATIGATVQQTINLQGSLTRSAGLAGTFDGTVYVLSVHLSEPLGSGAVLRLRLALVGGFLVASLVDLGDQPIVLAWGWKLETPDLTAYVKREGT